MVPTSTSMLKTSSAIYDHTIVTTETDILMDGGADANREKIMHAQVIASVPSRSRNKKRCPPKAGILKPKKGTGEATGRKTWSPRSPGSPYSFWFRFCMWSSFFFLLHFWDKYWGVIWFSLQKSNSHFLYFFSYVLISVYNSIQYENKNQRKQNQYTCSKKASLRNTCISEWNCTRIHSF